MKGKRTIIIIGLICFVAAVCIGIWWMYQSLLAIGTGVDFSVESLRWTVIGAIGSWSGSVFGAIALVVSIFALWLPQRVKIKVSVSSGMVLGQVHGLPQIDAYIVTVKNAGVKPITVTNVYLHFGDRKQGDIFVGMLNQNSPLEALTPAFPKRLESGGFFDYYLLRDKLNAALTHYENKTPIGTPLSIRVDEVINGSKYYKTQWTLKNFVGSKKK